MMLLAAAVPAVRRGHGAPSEHDRTLAVDGTRLDEQRWVLESARQAHSTGAPECLSGGRRAAEDQCLAAAQEAAYTDGLEVAGFKTVSDGATGVVPSGCSYSLNSKMAVFNSDPAGANRVGNYRLICLAPPGEMLSSAAPHGESPSSAAPGLPSIALLFSGDPMHTSSKGPGKAWAKNWYEHSPDSRPSERFGALRRSVADLAHFATPSLFVFAVGYSSAWQPFVDSARDILTYANVSEECSDRPFDAQFTNVYCSVLMMRARELGTGSLFRFAARMRTDIPVTFRRAWFNPSDADEAKLLLTAATALQLPEDQFAPEMCRSPGKKQGTFNDQFMFGSSLLVGDLMYHARPLSNHTERNLFQILVYLNGTYSPVDINGVDSQCAMCGKMAVRVNATGVFFRPDLAQSWDHTCVMDWEQDSALLAARRRDLRMLSEGSPAPNSPWQALRRRAAHSANHPDESVEDPLPFDFPRGTNPTIPDCTNKRATTGPRLHWILEKLSWRANDGAATQSCSPGIRGAAEDLCFEAVQEAASKRGLEVVGFKTLEDGEYGDGGPSGFIPAGCSYSLNSKMAVFNSDPTGADRGGNYLLACLAPSE